MAQAPTATSVVHVDNDRVTVTEWRFAPGASTGFHEHGMDYVITPLMDGRLTLVDAVGNVVEAELRRGQSYFRQKGVQHDVINASGSDFAFVEVELKQ